MRGLMFRKDLQPDSGMLFVYGNDAIRSFWMKNTYIPLDMIFVTAIIKSSIYIIMQSLLTRHP